MGREGHGNAHQLDCGGTVVGLVQIQKVCKCNSPKASQPVLLRSLHACSSTLPCSTSTTTPRGTSTLVQGGDRDLTGRIVAERASICKHLQAPRRSFLLTAFSFQSCAARRERPIHSQDQEGSDSSDQTRHQQGKRTIT
jgi:hypothetical protein